MRRYVIAVIALLLCQISFAQFLHHVSVGGTSGGVSTQQLSDSMTAVKAAGIGSRGVAGQFGKWVSTDSLDSGVALIPGDTTGMAKRSDTSNGYSVTTTKMNTAIAAANLADTNYLHLRAVEIKPMMWTQLDSSIINATDKYPLPYSQGFTTDTVVVETWNGAACSVVPVLSHGLDISAAGTSFGSLGTITSNTVAIYVVNTTAILRGERVWLSFSSVTTKPSKFSITILGHRTLP